MKINDNIAALQTYTNLLRTGRKIDKSVVRLSSGYKINSVADDAAGMAISKKLKDQISGMEMAMRNTLDAVSMAQTADGAMTEIHNMLQRIRELAVNMSNDSNLDEDREKADAEVASLLQEINDTAYKTEFNTIKMLAGHAEEVEGDPADPDAWNFMGLQLQVGANKDMTVTYNIPNVSKLMDKIAAGDGTTDYPGYFPAGGLFDPLNGENEAYRVNLKTREADQLTIDFCDQAIAEISTIRSTLGAYVNRLEMTEKNLAATKENTEAALSRVLDTDMALEMTYNAQNSIINQAAIAILGQANQRPQQIIQLLQ
ncbi:MAG: flagellin [Clostridiales bacterium]|jgi:flagellin|nr:flagellin [Clostridiales bacterium]